MVIENEIEIFKDDEIEKILNAVFNFCEIRQNFSDCVRIWIGLRLGLRSDEINGLYWKDIDFDNLILSIQRQVTYEDGDAKPKITNRLKTRNSKRRLRLSQEDIKMFSDYKRWRKELSLKLGANFRPTENWMVVCNEHGQPLSQSSPNRRYERILKAAGVKYKKFPCTRHTYASKRIQSGHDIVTVSRALVHSKTQTTLNTYVNATADIF